MVSGIGNHAYTDAVFHAGQGILAFQFRHHLGTHSLRNPVQAHQGRMPNQLRHILCDFHKI
jgi:hypothetical protein